MILPGEQPEAITAAGRCLVSGGLVGLPTETVYGLAADADNDAAVAQIFKAKGRPADHPLIVHVASVAAVPHYASQVPDFAAALMAAFWPGPLTLILPRRPGVANAAAGGNPTIGLRCPAHPVAQALLNWGQIPINFQAGSKNSQQLDTDPNYSDPNYSSSAPAFVTPARFNGLAAPSANQFGRVSPTSAQHVAGEFGDDLLILDGGACLVGIESTIIDCTRGAPVLLRPGAITAAQVQVACGQKLLLNSELPVQTNQAPKASGTLESHYAPRAKVRLMDAEALRTAVKLLAVDSSALPADQPAPSPAIALYCRSSLAAKSPLILQRQMPSSAAATAQELFAALRTFDDAGVKLIWVESPPLSPEWDGVRDRLQRATTQ